MWVHSKDNALLRAGSKYEEESVFGLELGTTKDANLRTRDYG